MMRIKDKATEWAYGLQTQLQSQAQAEYVQKVMKWEECSWDEALAKCTRRADPPEPEYSLGYKMCDPLGILARNTQIGRKRRQQAKKEFMEMLEPDELELYKHEVVEKGFRKQFNDALKRKQEEVQNDRNI